MATTTRNDVIVGKTNTYPKSEVFPKVICNSAIFDECGMRHIYSGTHESILICSDGTDSIESSHAVRCFRSEIIRWDRSGPEYVISRKRHDDRIQFAF